MPGKVKSKAVPLTGRGSLQGCETSRISCCLDNRLILCASATYYKDGFTFLLFPVSASNLNGAACKPGEVISSALPAVFCSAAPVWTAYGGSIGFSSHAQGVKFLLPQRFPFPCLSSNTGSRSHRYLYICIRWHV
jgi:hypothetical protein